MENNAMRSLLVAAAAAFLAACSYNYKLTQDENAAPETVATIKFSNKIKVSEIDGKTFERKFSIWVEGSHEITLPPGSHSFKFKYDARSLNGGWYTDNDTVLTRYLEAGTKYELTASVRNGRVFFAILPIPELVAEDKPAN
jgi:hypothetical protein